LSEVRDQPEDDGEDDPDRSQDVAEPIEFSPDLCHGRLRLADQLRELAKDGVVAYADDYAFAEALDDLGALEQQILSDERILGVGALDAARFRNVALGENGVVD